MGAVIAALAVTLIFSRHSPARQVVGQAETSAQVVDSKSIAVLPFENMSEDKGNAFFADGVHEDVLTNLSFIRDLRVISRTSVMQYRGTTKPIKQIGRELGVAYVLEGSVRREGNKVRVTGQLIDARTDAHVWGKAYDRDVTDIFAIQGELAEAIAGALQSVISPETKALIARRPTENSAAYDDYLKARQIRNSAEFIEKEDDIPLLEDAVRLDPRFAPAWAELGSRRAYAYFQFEQSERQLDSAKEAIDVAVRLAPDDPAVIEGLGDYYYYGYRDYIRATEQYLRLAQMRPNDPVVYFSLGLIQRRQGRWVDAIPNLLRGPKLDPTNYSYVREVTWSLIAVRRYDQAQTVIQAYMETHPQKLEAAFVFSYSAFLALGSTTEMQAFAHRTVEPSKRSEYLYFQTLNAQLCGNWAEFIHLDREQRYYNNSPGFPHWYQDINAAESFAESGDMAEARARATDAKGLLNAELARQPDNSELWAYLSLACALLGDKGEAMRSAQRSVELMPESRDAVDGPNNSVTRAHALAWIGEKNQALAEIERLLHVPVMPWGMNIYENRASWRPLQDEPRFKELVLDKKNNEPLF